MDTTNRSHTTPAMQKETSYSVPTTPEEIAQRKAELLQEITAHREHMADFIRHLFNPPSPPVTKTAAIMKAFNTGMAVFDGAMMGIKVMRRIRTFFGKR